MDYFDIEIEDMIVIYDDLDLDVGKLRLRQKGSAGGHNGIKSLIHHLGTQEFNRIRVGISRPPAGMKVPDYVLSKFTKEEDPIIEEAVEKTVKAVEVSLSKKFLDVMSEFNS
ncbi:peptidyl-tRNA hydrolase [Rhizophagus irregularis]|nr:peptidyl-tRNA hydrolase [Rhizophagus irregularis]